MAFKIEKANDPRTFRPEGNYVRFSDNSEQLIENLTISASERICLHLYDPKAKQRQIITICTLAELVGTIDGATYVGD
jgi:ribosomal protein L14